MLSGFEVRRLDSLYRSCLEEQEAAGKHFRQMLWPATWAATIVLALGRNPDMTMLGRIGAISLVMCEAIVSAILVFYGLRWVSARENARDLRARLREDDLLACQSDDVLES